MVRCLAGHNWGTNSPRSAWRKKLPAFTNAPIAIDDETLITAASYPGGKGQTTEVIAFRLGAHGTLTPTTAPGGSGSGGPATGGAVFIAVPWPRVPEAVQGLRWDGRIVIDATNDFDPSDLNGLTSSQVLADLVPGARVVKAGNTLGTAVLGAGPHEAGGRRVIFFSGDDAEAKSEVSALFEDAGFAALDLGGLVTGGGDAAAPRPAGRRQPDPACVATPARRGWCGRLSTRTFASSTYRSARASRSASTGTSRATANIAAARR